MSTGRLVFGLFLIIMGVTALTGIDLFRFVVPALLIALGVKVLTGKTWRGIHSSGKLAQDTLNEVYIFSGTRKRIASSGFTGGKVVAVFGSAELDLSDVTTKEKTVEMELVAVFGAVQVRVPKGWNVATEGAGVLGGFENRTAAGTIGKPRCIVKGAAIFGGIEIIN